MITVKMLKQFLDKMPDDALVAMHYEDDLRFQDLAKVSLEEVKFENDNEEVLTKKFVNLRFIDMADVLTEFLYLNDEEYICSPSLLYSHIENKAKELPDIPNFNFIDKQKKISRDRVECSQKINKSKPNIIDRILVNELLLKLEKNMDEILDMYRDFKSNNTRTYQSFRDKLRMLLFKE